MRNNLTLPFYADYMLLKTKNKYKKVEIKITDYESIFLKHNDFLLIGNLDEKPINIKFSELNKIKAD